MSAHDRMLDRFVRLRETPSPTGSERAAADLVAAELRDLGVEVSEEGAAGSAPAGAGDLIARVPGRGEGWVMLCAHLDNEASVAALVELAARAAGSRPATGVELVLPVAEDDGRCGARLLDLEALRSPFGFVLDHASPIGEVLTAGPTCNRLVAEFEGIEAQAGLAPEGGHSAIEAAAAAVASMQLGRIDPSTTANVGLISGGRSPSPVAAQCRIEGEVRSLDAARASEVTQAMVEACAWAASERGCDVDLDVTEVFRGYRLPAGAPTLRMAAEALRRCGHEPRELPTAEGSVASALLARGFDCVLLASGTEGPNAPEDRVAVARIEELVALCEAIVEVAGEAD